ncbi:MAG: MFS transporter [Acidimicrobiales bacterium]|nr:MFS transporter [Acidimicrobiales bacterium]MCB9394328.1 MFS transporter [Acidimicrobiaceae bacterium]
MGIVDAVSPPRLGTAYRRLLASSWITNLGDGVGLAAGPLLVASQTDDAFLVAMAALLQRLPWLLLGLHAGVVADRHDRRRIVVVANLARAAVLLALTVAAMVDGLGVAVVLVSVFLIGTAEVFADTTANTLMPMIVAPGDLGLANSRVQAGHVVVNQLAGPPIGAFLFAVGIAWPLAAQVVLFVAGAAALTRVALPAPERRLDERRARHEIAEGLRWLWTNRPVRTLTITVVSFNVTFGAAWSVLVLVASERLGLGEVGFGVLTTMSALGAVLGAWGYARLASKVSLADIMRAGLVIETVTHLTLATTTSPLLAMPVLFLFGVHEAAWGTTAVSIRQRAVPDELQGRVASAYLLGVFGGLVVGAALGGVLAGAWGVTAPFWFAFVGSALILVLIWRTLEGISHAGEESSLVVAAP